MRLELKRRPDWQIRLNDYIAKVQKRKHKYGTFDCCIFVAGAVKAMTGVDGMKEFRKQYKDEKSYGEALKRIGKKTLYATLQSKLGRAVPGSNGKKGDVCYYQGLPGIIIGRHGYFFTEEAGFVFTPIKNITRAFRVKF